MNSALPSKKVLFVVIVLVVAAGLAMTSVFGRTRNVYHIVAAITDNVNDFHAKLLAFGRDQPFKKVLSFQSMFQAANTTTDTTQPAVTVKKNSQHSSTSLKSMIKPVTRNEQVVKSRKVIKTKKNISRPILPKMPVLPPKHLFQQTNRTLPTTKLVLMSTWNETEEKMLVHGNVLRTWKLWQPTVLPMLFSNDSTLTSRALANQWRVLPLLSVTCGDMPTLRGMFVQAMAEVDSVFYGFANSDILLSEGVQRTVSVIAQLELAYTTPLMMLISRTNTNFSAGPRLDDVAGIHELKAKGWPLKDGSADVFITNRLFPWKYVPDIVVGRIGIGMWIVSYARAMNVTVIDLSKTTIAIHMTTKSGNYESHWKPNGRCNHKLFEKLDIRPPSWRCGFITCAAMETSYGPKNGTIRLTGRNRFRYDPRCLECPMNLTSIGL